jgi:predicted TIM-barrel fold metal-dependent hydrolase
MVRIIGHPKHLDQVATNFPELTLIDGLGDWPWVKEMVALVRRHPNLYVDTSAHRAKYLGQPDETLIQEYLDLPLKDSVKEKWLYRNAARVFGLA